MTAKRKIQILIDILMTVMLPFLMAYQLIGEAIHEWMGIGMCLLFLCHHILNWHWHKNILKGRYNLFRIAGTTVDILLIIIMAVLMISGIMMSKHIFNLGHMGSARTAHLLASYWGFVLMSIHIGLHLNMILAKVKRAVKIKKNIVGRSIILRAIIFLVCFYGIYAFIKRQLGVYMLFKSKFVFFDFEEPVIYFIFDYILIMCLFSYFGYYFCKILKLHKNKTL